MLLKFSVNVFFLIIVTSSLFIEAEELKSDMLIQTCSACHGPDGNSVSNQIPNIAGLDENYILKQLLDFKSDKRESKDMYGITQAISSETEMKVLAQYFSKQEMHNINDEVDFSKNRFIKLKLGKSIYEGRRIEYGIPACGACHGKDAMGTKEGKYPRLKDQHREYIITQMQLFQTKKRSNDNPSMMRNIAMMMDKEDIESVAAYISTMQ